MDEQQARDLIRNTFEKSFDRFRFISFVKNLLNRIEDSTFIYRGQYIPDAYKLNIESLERIGKYSDGENNIDILVVNLKRETSLERARTMQRNFIAWYLNGSRGGVLKDAALAAFVSSDKSDWRFSLVKMDYKFEQTKTGRMKAKEEFTPARRWSFLVGANENSHTAQSRLVEILANDQQTATLAQLEEAFNIETVTKEFFLKYRDLFIRTKEALDKLMKNDTRIHAEFTSKGVNNVDFAKKLLGQIIFLYFLQKKGWFGVARDSGWGNGSKHFLRELFEKKHGGYKNFFNDILEPLFYEALRIDRSHDDNYYSRFNCKIPFLNGGLFDPIGNYDWVHTDVCLPDSQFSNKNKTKEGDIGDGILDIFDRYNFTVKEDEPLEKEVAIDPELLGKAYEKFNAIRPDNFEEYKKALKSGKKGEESKFNKQYGVYYTPREIVHYMCQQSLVNYLAIVLSSVTSEEVGIKPPTKEDIDLLIHTGGQINENEEIALVKEQYINQGKQKASNYKLILPDAIRKYAKRIDGKLAEITVCDPAVGSGAFPVGMMSEIVNARTVLAKFIKDKNRSTYDFKRRCIEHSLFGVDIDPGAVEIAKLRLWLSLVVDEDDINNIKPLPNLDYKIMQGNSLVELLSAEPLMSTIDQGRNELVKELKKAKGELFNISVPTQKEQKRRDIEILIKELFEYDRNKQIKRLQSINLAIKSQKRLFENDKDRKEEEYKSREIESKIEEVRNARLPGPMEHFEWRINYSEVFQDKDGFDVVIANPPYGANIDSLTKVLEKNYPNTTKSFKDSYKVFIELALNKLSNKNGIIVYIVPNTLLRQPRYKDVRNLLMKHKVIEVVNLGEGVFDQGVVPTCVFFAYSICDQSKYVLYKDLSTKSKYIGKVLPESNMVKIGSIFADSDNNKQINLTLDMVLDLKDAGINYQRINVGLHEKGRSDLGQRLLYEGTKENPQDVMFWKGGDIEAYFIAQVTKRWVRIKTTCKLRDNERVILNEGYFKKVPKLIWRQTASFPIVAVDTQGIWFGRSIQAAIIKPEYKKFDYNFVLGVLNSKYFRGLYNQLVQEAGRVFPQVKLEYLKSLPFCDATAYQQEQIIKIVNRILAVKRDNRLADTTELEKQIDHLVCLLYGLTEKEIRIIEGGDENID